ncbi:MAG TPA: serine--tRNA ligase [Candidatus Paceibacterota bacterium]|nr:serine--tRNA ligase [Candidatus Paceibacterota bacterium]
MIDIKLLRENREKVKKACENKGAKIDIDKVLELDKNKREVIKKTEELRAQRARTEYAPEKEAELRKLKDDIKKGEQKRDELNLKFQVSFNQIPNLPLDDVPIGSNETGNKVIKAVGKTEKGLRDYMEIAEKLDIIDVKRAAKTSGSRFGYLKGDLAILEFGLVRLAFDVLGKEGFIPVIPPVMIKPEMAKGMGYIEQTNSEEAYYINSDNLYLIGTSEQSLGAMHADEIFNENELPKRYVGFSTCFRREAGSYGKDTKGILRVHQFDKVEMFSFCKPEDSIKEHKFLLSLEEKLMNLLKIPYRVVQMCTGDLGHPAAAKYDIEAWFPGQNEYRETHSTSSCTDFQARRLNIKYKTKNGLEFVHTLNGTAFAIGRTLIAIIENYQQKDGSIKVPKVLRKYTGIKCIVTK